jgi:hypothetical protein
MTGEDLDTHYFLYYIIRQGLQKELYNAFDCLHAIYRICPPPLFYGVGFLRMRSD